MKTITKYLCVCLLGAFMMVSCQSMLESETDRYLMVEDNKLNNPNDSVYSVMGILSKMQLLGDAYVILGEMRADLMDVTDNADASLREINSLNISNDNEWIQVGNYYDLINHCNYLITRMDTSLTDHGMKIMQREFAVAKIIRAWAYMQMVYNFNEAYYLTEPILTIDDVQKKRERIGGDEIMEYLIKDLQEVEYMGLPEYGTLHTYESLSFYPSVAYLLGDIYLWRNEYAKAAQKYYECMVRENRYQAYASSSWADALTLDQGWPRKYSSIGLSGEVTAIIPYYYSAQFGKYNGTNMLRMTVMDYTIAPSQRARNLFESQAYLEPGFSAIGDLRGKYGSYEYNEIDPELRITGAPGKMYQDLSNIPEKAPYITIYNYGDRDAMAIYLQCNSLLYYRYAEAVNQMNMPSLAMAIVNYGLRYEVISDSTIVNRSEVFINGQPDMPKYSWLDLFEKQVFVAASSYRQCGQGFAAYADFPATIQTMQDSVAYMEKLLADECAMETAFNGNRYVDLMRMSRHQIDRAASPTIIAEAIAEKHAGEYSSYYAKMLDPKNWYITYPEE